MHFAWLPHICLGPFQSVILTAIRVTFKKCKPDLISLLKALK